jgi:hypothetical protein
MKQRIKIDKPPEWGYIETVGVFDGPAVFAADAQRARWAGI